MGRAGPVPLPGPRTLIPVTLWHTAFAPDAGGLMKYVGIIVVVVIFAFVLMLIRKNRDASGS